MCTALTIVNDGMFFGRNLDLDEHFNEQIVIVSRNYPIVLKNESSLDQHYAIMGTATLINHYPLFADGFNEKGLAMAGLNFPHGCSYSDTPKQNCINLTPYEIILYTLAKYETVAQVKKDYQNLNLYAQDFMTGVGCATLHWILSDEHDCIVIESRHDGLKIIDNPTGIMTNCPNFEYHLTNLDYYISLNTKQPTNQWMKDMDLKVIGSGSGSFGLPGDYSSPSRMIRANFLKQAFVKTADVDETVVSFFHTLDGVSYVKGSAVNENGTLEYTLYSNCFDTKRKTYYYKTYQGYQIAKLSMDHVDLDVNQIYHYPMHQNIHFIDENVT